MEDRRCSDDEPQEEAQARVQGGGRSAPRGADVGGLDLGGEEGGEGDVGHQGGAGVVDQGVDLLGLLAAGFDLEREEKSLITPPPEHSSPPPTPPRWLHLFMGSGTPTGC